MPEPDNCFGDIEFTLACLEDEHRDNPANDWPCEDPDDYDFENDY